MPDQTVQDYLQRRRSSLTNERTSFISHYKDISEFIQPRRGRFLVTDRNRGDKRHNHIINSKGTQALRTATAGIFSGIMSPTRPWFNLATNDPELMEFMPVKVWLAQVERMLRAIFNSSNLYNMSPIMIAETILFGTGCMLHVDDFEDIARFYTQTVGSYMIAQNDRFEVDTLMREYEMTVAQMVGMFGKENCSQAVKDRYDKGDYDAWFPVVHFIEPNPEGAADAYFSVDKPFRSIYYEPGNINKEQVLRKSGFERFPAYCPRWGLAGEDVYGTDCPGMIALGDVKSLQIEEKRKARAIDLMVNPVLKGPASLRSVDVNSLPGGVNVYQAEPNGEGLSPVYQVQPQIQELMLDIDKTERRINEAFFVDLFLAISNMEGIQPKNQLELSQRNEERLLQLGPVLEQLHGEFLDRLIDRTFAQAIEAEILPEIPQELAGSELKVNYISSLAQAQRAVATGGIERLVTFVGGLAALTPENPAVLDKLDMDQAVDEYASAILTPPKIVKSDDRVAEERIARQQAQQMQQQLMMAQQGADVAKTLSDAAPKDEAGREQMREALNG